MKFKIFYSYYNKQDQKIFQTKIVKADSMVEAIYKLRSAHRARKETIGDIETITRLDK